MMEEKMHGKVCKCPHHKMLPLFLTLFGALFLLGNLAVFTPEFVNITWPILVLVAGLTKLFEDKCKCC